MYLFFMLCFSFVEHIIITKIAISYTSIPLTMANRVQIQKINLMKLCCLWFRPWIQSYCLVVALASTMLQPWDLWGISPYDNQWPKSHCSAHGGLVVKVLVPLKVAITRRYDSDAFFIDHELIPAGWEKLAKGRARPFFPALGAEFSKLSEKFME